MLSIIFNHLKKKENTLYYLFSKIKINKQIPFHERYETIDFKPSTPIENITKKRINKQIPFHERYETIDFTPGIKK